MNDEELKDKVKKIFYGLEVFKPESLKKKNNEVFRNILVNMYNPPAYMVKIIMIDILNLPSFGREDKVLWHTYFKFQNHHFKIRDYKFGTWTLIGLTDNEDIFEETLKIGDMIHSREKIKEDSSIYKTALILKKKIIIASSLYNNYFQKEIFDKKKIDNYFLLSSYNKLLNIYNFFKNKLEESMKDLEKFKEIGKNEEFRINFNNPIEEEIEIMGTKTKLKSYDILFNIEKPRLKSANSNYTFALISIFFSLLEFILESFYLFGPRPEKFINFEKERWYDKFKLVFPIKTNEKLKKIYDELGHIKKEYRNPLIHGLIGDICLLIPLSGIGLVPISYEYLTDNVAFGLTEISSKNCYKIKEVFESFLNLLNNMEPYKYYLLYFEFEFPIPINKNNILKIKNQMTSYDEFKEDLIDRAKYENMIRNRDF